MLREIQSGETYTVDTWSFSEWARERLWDVEGRLVFDRYYLVNDSLNKEAECLDD